MSANRQRIADMFASLYVDEDGPSASKDMTGQANTSTGSEGSTITATCPSQSEIDNVWKLLYNSFKITAVTNCPVPAHQPLSFCSCPIGLANMSVRDVYRTKVNCFMLGWDLKLMVPESDALDYNGDEASHRTFVVKNGITPTQFALNFVQEVKDMFGPSGDKNDLAKALIEFWKMRTRSWKTQYRTADEVKSQWFPKVYNTSKSDWLDFNGVMDLVDLDVGMVANIQEVTMGHPDHQSQVSLVPLAKLKKGFAVKIVKSKVCHDNCPTARSYWVHHLKDAAVRAAHRHGYGKVDDSRIRLGTAAEMRAWYGLSPPKVYATPQ